MLVVPTLQLPISLLLENIASALTLWPDLTLIRLPPGGATTAVSMSITTLPGAAIVEGLLSAFVLDESPLVCLVGCMEMLLLVSCSINPGFVKAAFRSISSTNFERR